MRVRGMAEPWGNPILRWAGSKRKLLPHLIEYAPIAYRRYIEPFAGSACLFFALKPKAAILGDINSELMSFYSLVRRHPRIIARRADSLSVSERNYYRIRERFNGDCDSVSRAVYFLYLNRHCFNGVYRTNRMGHFNVPYGSQTGALPNEASVYRCAVALRNATLITSDFRDTMRHIRRGDFVYLDPPYSSCDRPRYGEYGYGSFQPLELAHLINALEEIDRRGAHFMVSYCHTLHSQKSFSAFRLRQVQVRRHVAGFAQHRRVVRELLVSNY